MRFAILGFLILLASASPAHAADEGETIVQAKDTVRAITKAHKDGDLEALQTGYARLIELHNGMEGADWRKRFQAIVGRVLADKKCPELHEASLAALESLDDGDGVYAQVKKLLPKPAEKPSEMHLEVIRVVGHVKSEKAVKALLNLAHKGKHPESRTAAITALSNYRGVGKQRVKVLKGLVELLVSATPGDEPSASEVDNWAAIEEPLVKALDELTYLDLETSRAWRDWYGENKSKLKNVFKGVEVDGEDDD